MYKLKLGHWYLTFFFMAFGAMAGQVESRSIDKQNRLTAEHRQMAIKRHKMMAELHGELTRCLESGKSYENCHEEAAFRCKKSFGGTCPGFAPPGFKPDSPMREGGCFWMLPKGDSSSEAGKIPSK